MSKSRRNYRPRTPETQSPLSIWVVRAELMLTTALALAVIIYIKRPEDLSPTAFTPPVTQSIYAPLEASAETDADVDGPDALKGRALFMQSCTSCHGATAEGLPRMGPNLRQSSFVASTSDLRLIAFLKNGRPATDPKNTMGVPMPSRGGNLALSDKSLADIVAFLRQVQKP